MLKKYQSGLIPNKNFGEIIEILSKSVIKDIIIEYYQNSVSQKIFSMDSKYTKKDITIA